MAHGPLVYNLTSSNSCPLEYLCSLLTTFVVFKYRGQSIYSKCPKISNTKVSEKMTYANSADPDQTAPEGAV